MRRVCYAGLFFILLSGPLVGGSAARELAPLPPAPRQEMPGPADLPPAGPGIGPESIPSFWQIEIVDRGDDLGSGSALALDGDGHAHVAYCDNWNMVLKYAFFDGTFWQVRTVDDLNIVWGSIALALDGEDQPHISYQAMDFDEGLWYAHHDGISWQFEMVDSGYTVGADSSIALDAAGRPHISYLVESSHLLKYAHYDGSAWQIQEVDSQAIASDSGSALALDAAGRPHISYYAVGDDLRYAYLDGSTWTAQTVDGAGDVGRYSALALDTAGRPRISYYDTTDGDLNYASFDGTAWHTQTVDSLGNVGTFTSLALDPAGNPHISYADSGNADLKLAVHDGSAWQVQTVDAEGFVTGVGTLALNAAGQPAVSYRDDAVLGLKVAIGLESCLPVDGADFRWTPFDPLPGTFVDFTGRANGAAPITYTWAFGDGDTAVGPLPTHSYALTGTYTATMTATNPCGQQVVQHTVAIVCLPLAMVSFDWTPLTPTTGVEARFAAFAEGNPPIAFTWDMGDGTLRTGSALRHVYLESGSYTVTMTATNPCGEQVVRGALVVSQGTLWAREVARQPGGGPASLALDAAGRPHVSYGTPAGLHYAYLDDTAWHAETVDGAGSISPSLALDAAGRPHIAYYDDANDRVKYAHDDGAGWQIEIVASGVSFGQPSLALDSQGHPHVSYTRGVCNEDCGAPLSICCYYSLYHAHSDGGVWLIELWAEAGREAGQAPDGPVQPIRIVRLHYDHSFLVVDAGDQPHIAYRHYVYDDDVLDPAPPTIYARLMYDHQVVDRGGLMGYDPALALDGQDYPHIAYHDATLGDLKYAAHNGTSWYTETVDSVDIVGLGPALALDAAGRPRIAYYDQAQTDLKYAASDGSSWRVETVDAAGNVGRWASLVVEAAGRPHIAYSDETNNALKYARTYQGPEAVLVHGPFSLVPDLLGTYRAASWPVSSIPITLSWDNGTVGESAGYAWPAVGSYTLTVTGTDRLGQAQGSFTVRVLAEWPFHFYLPIVATRFAPLACCADRPSPEVGHPLPAR